MFKMKMSIKKVEEEFDHVARFIYHDHSEDWGRYGNEHRGGAQHLENLSALIESLSKPRPTRFVISRELLNNMEEWFDNIAKTSESNANEARSILKEFERWKGELLC
jgi:hypothetical protein